MWEKIVLNLLSNALKFTFEGDDHASRCGCAATGAELTVARHRRRHPRATSCRGSSSASTACTARARAPTKARASGWRWCSELVRLHGGDIRVGSAARRGARPSRVTHPARARRTCPADRVAPAPPARAALAGPTPSSTRRCAGCPRSAAAGSRRAGGDGRADAAPASCSPTTTPTCATTWRRLLARPGRSRRCADGAPALGAARARPARSGAHRRDDAGARRLRAAARAARRPRTARDAGDHAVGARGRGGAASRGCEAGADDYLVKPFSARELLAASTPSSRGARLRRREAAARERLRLAVRAGAGGDRASCAGRSYVFEFANPQLPCSWSAGREVVGKPLVEALPGAGAARASSSCSSGVSATGRAVHRHRGPAAVLSSSAVRRADAGGALLQLRLPAAAATARRRCEAIAVVATDVHRAGARRGSDAPRRPTAPRTSSWRCSATSCATRWRRSSPRCSSCGCARRRRSSASATIIERQVQHLVRLVDDLLDVSRITRGKIELSSEPVELADVVAKAIEMASPLLEQRQHTSTVDVPRDGAAGRRRSGAPGAGDRRTCCTNAAKYTEPGRRISPSSRAREGRRSCCRVRDTGIGIAPEMLPRDVRSVRAGAPGARPVAGRARPRPRDRAAAWSSCTAARSRSTSAGLGQGSEFTVRLPLRRRGELPDGRRPRFGGCRRGPRPAPGLRILVVDDNVDAAESSPRCCELLGYEVRGRARRADGAAVAARAFSRHLALLDIGLPVMDGYELAQRLRSPSTPTLRLVAVTGYGQDADRRRAPRPASTRTW